LAQRSYNNNRRRKLCFSVNIKGVNSMPDKHEHNHHYPHTRTKAVVNRLSRAIGHLEAIRRMVEDGRDCSEVLIQLAAVKAAINSTGRVIVKDHMEHCIVAALERQDHEALEDLNKAIEQFMK
jgi:DNA-binding FrmR family transcriptional regulator